jgi:hypothetical protein
MKKACNHGCRWLGRFLVGTLAAVLGWGCGTECEDGLRVDLMSGFDGEYHFEGRADGEAFACRYAVLQWGGEFMEARDRGCEGPVRLVTARYEDPELIGYVEWMRAVFDGAPAVLDWQWWSEEPIRGESEPTHRAGRLEPDYGGCGSVDASIPDGGR